MHSVGFKRVANDRRQTHTHTQTATCASACSRTRPRSSRTPSTDPPTSATRVTRVVDSPTRSRSRGCSRAQCRICGHSAWHRREADAPALHPVARVVPLAVPPHPALCPLHGRTTRGANPPPSSLPPTFTAHGRRPTHFFLSNFFLACFCAGRDRAADDGQPQGAVRGAPEAARPGGARGRLARAYAERPPGPRVHVARGAARPHRLDPHARPAPPRGPVGVLGQGRCRARALSGKGAVWARAPPGKDGASNMANRGTARVLCLFRLTATCCCCR